MDINREKLASACEKCILAKLCLPLGLDEKEVHLLDKLIKNRRVLKKQDFLFRQKQEFHSLYALRTGSLKSVIYQEQSDSHISDFHFPGEVIGLDAIHSQSYHSDCIALETSSVCIISYEELLNLTNELPSLNRHIMNILSENFSCANERNPLLLSADKRVAKFLTNLTLRAQRLGRSSTTLLLPMTQRDIANHLGLANETLSRVLKRLVKQQLISLKDKELKILDPIALQALLCHQDQKNS